MRVHLAKRGEKRPKLGRQGGHRDRKGPLHEIWWVRLESALGSSQNQGLPPLPGLCPRSVLSPPPWRRLMTVQHAEACQHPFVPISTQLLPQLCLPLRRSLLSSQTSKMKRVLKSGSGTISKWGAVPPLSLPLKQAWLFPDLRQL